MSPFPAVLARAVPVGTATLALAASLAACAAPTAPAPAAAGSAPAVSYAAASAPSALTTLNRLPVKGRAPMTGYARDRYGRAWTDTDRNGCDQRNDILKRDLTREVFRSGTRGCVVLTGVLKDPYTAKTIAFQRGVRTSMAVQVDHVVALANSWVTGAQRWPAAKRVQFANDPLVLLAVDGPTNQRKGAADAATWLPPNKGYRCAYVARQVAIKAKYGLWVTSAEKAAIARVLKACPAQPLPTR